MSNKNIESQSNKKNDRYQLVRSFLGKCFAALVITVYSPMHGDELLGIIGGVQSGLGYAALVSSSGNLTPIAPSANDIYSVAMNTNGLSLIGGSSGLNGYAAFVSSTGTLTQITGIPGGTTIVNSVAINSSNQGLIVGLEGGNGYGALVLPSGTATTLTLTGTAGGAEMYGAAINNSGLGLIGGYGGSLNGYAAQVSSSGMVNQITLPGSPAIRSQINGVAINSSGQGIIGGYQNTTIAYGAIVSSSGAATLITNLPVAANTIINSVAINSSGQGIIGGGNAYAAFVSSQGSAAAISGVTAGVTINGVAINSSGQGVIGGSNSYAALVPPSGTAMGLAVPVGVTIESVAIDDFGQGVIGGMSGTGAYGAIFSSSGVLTTLNIGSGIIYSVAILPALSKIPTGGLKGNNLIFANYVNANAPQLAFYFVPSILNGTLSSALESAAPTRNAFSLYTASNNLFYVTTDLSIHLRDRRSVNLQKEKAAESVARASEPSEDHLLASTRTLPNRRKAAQPRDQKLPKYNLWVEAVGALAYQKAQSQTPAFNPTTGGGIAAFEGIVARNTTVGGGAAYLFTHIHEKQGAGQSNINQEDLFVYASWDNSEWYVDGCVLGGLFQTRQVREIQMTGFAFTSRSKPHGGQLLPHLEVGYNYSSPECPRTFQLRVNPFGMLDWANNWQNHFIETGNGPFNASQKSHYSSLLRTEVGIRFYESFLFKTWSLTLQELGGYVNTQNFGAGKVTAFLVGSPGLFTVETLGSAQNLGVGQFLMIFSPVNWRYPVTTVSYQGEFGTKFQSHQANVEFAWSF